MTVKFVAARMSLIGTKRTSDDRHRMSAFGGKATSPIGAVMSANDPKQTSAAYDGPWRGLHVQQVFQSSDLFLWAGGAGLF